jgi:DNA polymerase epsilon subunit 1
MARGTFGLVSSRRARGSGGRGGFRGGSSSFRGRGRGRGGGAQGNTTHNIAAPARDEDGTALAERFERIDVNDGVDEKLGFPRIQEGSKREGWLVNMHPVSQF